MRSYRRKVLVITFALTLALLSMTGCGEAKTGITSVAIDKEGKVTHEIYEKFDRDYYDLQGLSDMAAQEISEYNVEYDTPKVTLGKAELIEDDKVARLSMVYESASDYSHFNQVSLFYGTVQEAIDRGYEVSKGLVNASGEKIDQEVIDKSLENHIIITSEKIDVITPYNIEYMSNGVSLNGKKEADLSAVTADSVQLLLSK